MRKWETLSREVLVRTPYCTFDHHRYCLPNGDVGDYYFVNSMGAVMVVPIDRDDRTILVRQHRYLLGEDSIEFPAGGMKRGVDPMEQAKQELAEETGFEAASWDHVGRFASWNGVTNELCLLYVARDLAPSEARPDATEEFELLRVTWGEVLDMVDRNEIFDGMTLASVALVRSQLNDYLNRTKRI